MGRGYPRLPTLFDRWPYAAGAGLPTISIAGCGVTAALPLSSLLCRIFSSLVEPSFSSFTEIVQQSVSTFVEICRIIFLVFPYQTCDNEIDRKLQFSTQHSCSYPPILVSTILFYTPYGVSVIKLIGGFRFVTRLVCDFFYAKRILSVIMKKGIQEYEKLKSQGYPTLCHPAAAPPFHVWSGHAESENL